MNKKLKIYNIIRIIVEIVSIICVFIPLFKYIDCVATSFMNLFDGNFVLYMIGTTGSALLIYYILKTCAVIWHEVGHLIYGLKAKLEFISFNILSFEFFIKEDKLKVKKTNLPKNVRGYCNMTLSKKHKSYNKAIKLYFMGGIIFNLISVILSLLLLIIIKNNVLDIIILLNMIINLYSAVYNSIPALLRSGNATDALQYLYCLEDETYFESISKIQRVNSLLLNGTLLEDIDEELFVKPKNINSKSDVVTAQLYIDYLIAHNKYKESFKFIEEVLEKGKEVISIPDASLIKIQLLNVLFELDKVQEIKKYWTKDDTKTLEFFANMYPSFMLLNYMYFLLVEKNEDKASKCLDKYNKMDKSRLDQNTLNELDDLMNKLKKSIS